MLPPNAEKASMSTSPELGFGYPAGISTPCEALPRRTPTPADGPPPEERESNASFIASVWLGFVAAHEPGMPVACGVPAKSLAQAAGAALSGDRGLNHMAL
mmetsp:Transcript_38601/g.106294  ORF Transcript_38601/g.106294 Transcript_38601/m.106294 type:complete len:101 (-) Transcript_38601:1097-1399(-)